MWGDGSPPAVPLEVLHVEASPTNGMFAIEGGKKDFAGIISCPIRIFGTNARIIVF